MTQRSDGSSPRLYGSRLDLPRGHEQRVGGHAFDRRVPECAPAARVRRAVAFLACVLVPAAPLWALQDPVVEDPVVDGEVAHGEVAHGEVVLEGVAQEDVAQEADDLERRVRGDLFGLALHGVGDVNDDGVPDVALGDPGGDEESVGRAWVLSSADGAVLHAWEGQRPGDGFGCTITVPGDLDGDGVRDLLIGASGRSGEGLGYVRAFSGAGGGVLFSVDVTADGFKLPWTSAAPGPALCGVGDVNGDGRPDFAVGSSFAEPFAGYTPSDGAEPTPGPRGLVQVLSGLDGSVIHRFVGDAYGDRLGACVADVGDVDGDGRSDLAASAAPEHEAGRPGYVRIWSTVDGSILRRWDADADVRTFGLGLAGAGDLNDDGYADVLVSRPFARDASSVVACSGADGSVLARWSQRGSGSFGSTLTSLGDVDGDGRADFFVAAPVSFDPDEQPTAWILSGDADTELIGLRGDIHLDSHFGVSAAAIGDVDGDGVPDLAVGAASLRGRRAFPGVARFISGKTGDTLRTVLRPDV